ncbi:MAG: PilZ domain-containing protein [Desulfarculaceae bacterium]|nr:PilZ domain-containing protein [Desulfarculaceae bacterium]
MNDADKKDLMDDLLSGKDEVPSGDRDLDCYIYRTGASIVDGDMEIELQADDISEQDPKPLSTEKFELVGDDREMDRPSRKAPRVYVKDRPDCTVTIENKTYSLKDISMSGLGVSIETEFVFQLGEFLGDVISGIRIDLSGESFEELEYKIVHISPDARNNLVCGMVWLNPTPDKVKRLFEILKQLKSAS